jgi:hypothetical protein
MIIPAAFQKLEKRNKRRFISITSLVIVQAYLDPDCVKYSERKWNDFISSHLAVYSKDEKSPALTVLQGLLRNQPPEKSHGLRPWELFVEVARTMGLGPIDVSELMGNATNKFVDGLSPIIRFTCQSWWVLNTDEEIDWCYKWLALSFGTPSTPLKFAVLCGDYSDVVARLSAGDSPEAVDETGRTALHDLVVGRRCDWDMIRIANVLIDKGARIDVLDSEGHAPMRLLNIRLDDLGKESLLAKSDSCDKTMVFSSELIRLYDAMLQERGAHLSLTV